jgi:hypothetical protein
MSFGRVREKEGARKFLKREARGGEESERREHKNKFRVFEISTQNAKIEKSKTSQNTNKGHFCFSSFITARALLCIIYKRGKTFFRDLAYTHARARTRETETERGRVKARKEYHHPRTKREKGRGFYFIISRFFRVRKI